MWRIFHKLKQKIQNNKLASLICFSVCGYYFFRLITKNRAKSVKLSYFLLALSQNAIEEIVASSSLLLYFRGKGSQKWHQTDASILSKDQLYKLILKNQQIEVSSIREPTDLGLQVLAPSIALAGILAYFLANRSLNNEKKLQPLHYRTQTKLDDIVGMQEIKDQLQEIITFLKRRNTIGSNLHHKKQRLLINGPQGTGKTLFAKAIAGQSQCTFIYVQISDFNNVFLGEGVKKIKELFDFAEQRSPCVVYLNRLEDFGKDIIRNREVSYIQQEEMKNMLSQLQDEISSINRRGKIVIVASTNNLLELQSRILDTIEFDMQLQTFLPNEEERLQILQTKIKSYKNSINIQELNEIAKQTQNFSGTDLEQLIIESHSISSRDGKNKIDNLSLQESLKSSKLAIKCYKAINNFKQFHNKIYYNNIKKTINKIQYKMGNSDSHDIVKQQNKLIKKRRKKSQMYNQIQQSIQNDIYREQFSYSQMNINDSYVIQDDCILGVGNYGQVKQCYMKILQDEKFAVKILNDSQKNLKYFENELKALQMLVHPNIAQFCEIFQNDHCYYFVLEKCNGINFKDYVVQKQILTENEARKFFYQMCRSLQYANNLRLVHRDIKLENFLFAENDCQNLKLIDFGLSKIIENLEKMGSYIGTPQYVAPDVLEQKGYDKKCDIWSLGVCLFRMTIGYYPFQSQDSDQLLYSIQNDELDFSSLQISKQLQNLFKKIFMKKQKDRISIEDIFYHDWLKDIYIQNLTLINNCDLITAIGNIIQQYSQ